MRSSGRRSQNALRYTKIPRSSKMAEISIAENSFEEYKHEANNVINIKLVRTQEDVFDDNKTFKPDMTHQVFGESESIFGYRDLKVELFCTAARMVTYVNVKYTDKLSLERDGVAPDNIAEKLKDILEPGYFTNLDSFLGQLPKEHHFKPFGEKIHEYSVTKKNVKKQFEIYKTTIENLGFRSYHKRLQPFLLLYVDGASFIDDDDERWVFYLIFEKYTSDSETMYAFTGYATVYNYFAYPERIRPRISQVLIMPPNQKQGHAATLIQTFYNHCYARPEVLDITVEDPSENFQRVRDFVDVKNCSKLKSFQPEKLAEGFGYDMQWEAREKLKINRKQARRVYEILRLQNTSLFDQDAWLAYKLDVKKRLNMPFMKNGRDFQKLQRVLNPNELKATMTNLSREQRLEHLEKTFNELKEDYDRVIQRVITRS